MAKLDLDLATDIQPVSGFRAKSAALIKRVRQTGRPLVLTQHGRGIAVLLDIGRYQSVLEEIEALRDGDRGPHGAGQRPVGSEIAPRVAGQP